MIHPEESRRMIRDGMKRAVERRAEIKPYKLAHPVKLDVTFKELHDAEIVSYIPGVELPRGNEVVFGGTRYDGSGEVPAGFDAPPLIEPPAV
jgi:D-amino peptidase